MAGSIVQNVDDGDTTAQNPSKSYTVAATTPGNPLVIVIGCVTKTRTISGITDSAANSGWVAVDGMSGSTQGSAFMWWNPNPAASITSFRLNMSGTSKTSIQFFELGGAAGTINNGGAAHNATAHTTALTNPSEALTTTGPCIIIVGVGAAAAPSSVAAPFTLDTGTTGSGLIETAAHDIETSAGTYTCTFTQTSEVCTTVIAAFDIAASSTTFPITVTVTAPSLTVGVVRKGLVGVTSGTVSTPVSVVVKLVKLLVITAGAVSLTATVARRALLGVVASTVTIPVAAVRKGFVAVKTGNVSLPSTTARKGLVHIATGVVSATASVARKALLRVSAAVSLPVTVNTLLAKLLTITVGAVSLSASVSMRVAKGITITVGTVSANASVALRYIPAVVTRVVGWAIGGAWSSAWGFKPNAPEPEKPLDIQVPEQPDEPLR